MQELSMDEMLDPIAAMRSKLLAYDICSHT